jgi:hypothetical protein
MPMNHPLLHVAALPLTPRRKYVALAVAGASDLAQMIFAPAVVEGVMSPIEVAIDVTTAVALLLIVGFSWRFVFALAIELVPAVDLFPTWTAMVLSMPSRATLPPAKT